jgi:Fe-Mn family superoxide dismutase
MHSIAQLDYNLDKEASTNGIGKLLTPTAFNIAWTQYQTHLIERLNALVAGMCLPSGRTRRRGGNMKETPN